MLSACNNEKDSIDKNMKFKTLIMDGNNITGEVPNEIKNFSFLDEIETRGKVTYTVSFDIYGKDIIPSKTVSLDPGNNTFYILATLNDRSKVYTVTIRREPKYTVSFDTNGGTFVKSQSIIEGGLAISPEDPTKEGYTFIGWDYLFDTPVTKNITVTAQWNANTYIITYDANGGSIANNKQTVTYDDPYTLEPVSRTGYTFAGWYNGDTRYYDSIWKTPNDVTLKAKWDINSYRVIVYGGNGGTVHGEGHYDYASTATISAQTKLGYTWLGWYDEVGNILSSNQNYSFVIGNHDQIVSAKWKKNDDISDFNITSTESTCIITSVINKSKTSYIIPEYITRIDESAFFMCDNLISIVVPKGIDVINGYTFAYCSRLKSVIIPDSITSIGDRSFYDCKSLTSIVIPNKVAYVGSNAFGGCTSLTSITFKGTVAEWNAIALGNNWNFLVPATEVVCYDGIVSLK